MGCTQLPSYYLSKPFRAPRTAATTLLSLPQPEHNLTTCFQDGRLRLRSISPFILSCGFFLHGRSFNSWSGRVVEPQKARCHDKRLKDSVSLAGDFQGRNRCLRSRATHRCPGASCSPAHIQWAAFEGLNRGAWYLPFTLTSSCFLTRWVPPAVIHSRQTEAP